MGASREQIEFEAELRNEIALRRSRQNLLPFIQYLFPGGYDATWFHKYVCSVLDKFANNEITRLMIFIPPQHGKSTMMTEYLPAFLLGRNPDEKIILAAYNEELASKFNRKIQRVITHEKYGDIFPNTTLNAKNIVTDSRGSWVRNSSEFEIVNHQGSLRSTGVGGGIAGMPAKTALLDDVIKNAAEANSLTYRNAVYDWYTDELEARLHNDSKVAFTITRRHEDDLAGRLLKRDGTADKGGVWHVVKLPALKEDDSDPNDIREIGEALYPSRHSRERMEERKLNAPRTFAGLYQQRPAPAEGNILLKKYFKRYELHELPNGTNNCYIDTATSEEELKGNDPTGILTYRVWKNNLYIVNFQKGMWSMPSLVEKIKQVAERELNGRQSRIYIENKSNGRSTKQLLDQGTGLSVILENVKGKKHERVENELPVFEAGRIYLPLGEGWVDDFLLHCLSFPNIAHDEEVDCLTGAIRTGLGGANKPKGITVT